MATSISQKMRRFSSSSIDRLSKNARTHFIFGANTDVGKTVLSAGLCRTTPSDHDVYYVKPLQCGGSDERFVQKHASRTNTNTKTLYNWNTPSSPHTASRKEQFPVSDIEVLCTLNEHLAGIHDQATPSKPTTIWIETAGGVLSPSSASPENSGPQHASSPSESWGWSTQADVYRPLSTFPAVLIGDGRLGGISATLSSLESLLIRGYNVAGILLLETGFENHLAIREYISR
jgi:dethiobiotin synthetase/adenosylmethionine--8-amino-7-oxononanoate aminotransferase